MKTFYILFFIILGFNSIKAQTTEKFSYELSKYGRILVSPTFDQSKSEGKRAVVSMTDEAYFSNKIYDEIRKVFSGEDFVRMHKDSYFTIVISLSGDVLRCNFRINPEDKIILTDTRLYKLYLNFMKIKFDMSKAKIIEASDTISDFTDISGRLLPPEYRKSSKVK